MVIQAKHISHPSPIKNWDKRYTAQPSARNKVLSLCPSNGFLSAIQHLSVSRVWRMCVTLLSICVHRSRKVLLWRKLQQVLPRARSLARRYSVWSKTEMAHRQSIYSCPQIIRFIGTATPCIRVAGIKHVGIALWQQWYQGDIAPCLGACRWLCLKKRLVSHMLHADFMSGQLSVSVFHISHGARRAGKEKRCGVETFCWCQGQIATDLAALRWLQRSKCWKQLAKSTVQVRRQDFYFVSLSRMYIFDIRHNPVRNMKPTLRGVIPELLIPFFCAPIALRTITGWWRISHFVWFFTLERELSKWNRKTQWAYATANMAEACPLDRERSSARVWGAEWACELQVSREDMSAVWGTTPPSRSPKTGISVAKDNRADSKAIPAAAKELIVSLRYVLHAAKYLMHFELTS